MARIPISKFGLTQSSSPAKNARLLDNHLATIDDGDVVSIGRGTLYQIDDARVRVMRGDITIEAGPGSWLEYSSEGADKTVGPGTGLLFGYPDPNLRQPGTNYIAKNITLRGVGIRDVGKRVLPTYDVGHWPSPVEFFFIENGLVEYCRFPNGYGNSALNVNGMDTDNFTVQYNTFGSDPTRKVQGDAANVGGYRYPVLRGNVCRGGIGRHFIEMGTGIVDLVVEDNDADLQSDGLTHLGSWTASRSALVRRNTFRNWGYRGGASSVTVLPDAPQYNLDDGSSVFVDDHGDLLPLNKVWGVRLEDNLFEAGPECWPAAITIEGGDLRDHIYRRNLFRCNAGFYLVQQPNEPFEIGPENDFTPNRNGAAFIYLAQSLHAPTGPAYIGANILRRNATLFDIQDETWTTDSRVTGLDTNRRLAV